MPRTEHQEQKAFFQWARLQANLYPELALLFSVPNGGQRHVAVAAKLKSEGVKSGVPDVFLPVARNGKHGLFLEFKTEKGRLSENQKLWLTRLKEQGYATGVPRSFMDAKEMVMHYLDEG